MDTILLTLCIIAIVTAVTYPLVKLVRRRKRQEEQVGPNLAYDPQFLVYTQKEAEYQDMLNDRLPTTRGYTFPNAPANPRPRRTHFDARERNGFPHQRDAERSYSMDPLFTTPLYVAAIENNVPDTRETAPSYSGHGGEFGGSGASESYSAPCGDSSPSDGGGGGSD